MTYIVSGGALNSTHSLTHSLTQITFIAAVMRVVIDSIMRQFFVWKNGTAKMMSTKCSSRINKYHDYSMPLI